MDYFRLYEKCRLCPRQCGVNREQVPEGGPPGLCGQTHRMKVAYIGPHMGEEPPITGRSGSGTIFFTGCGLKCSFCQNVQISHQEFGAELTLNDFVARVYEMVAVDGVHNLNFVTPDPFFPHVFHAVSILRKRGVGVPSIFNVSGYQSMNMLKLSEPYVDIYLPDFKYGDSSLALRLSNCRDYSKVALEAVSEMVRQKGFLRIASRGARTARRGVLVRHLILPGHLENTIQALTSLYVEFGPQLPLSLMSQYYPVVPQRDDGLNRFLAPEEFDRALEAAVQLGFENLYVQPIGGKFRNFGEKPRFLPDFRKEDPFDQKPRATMTGL